MNFVDSLDVVLQIIKSQIKVIVLIARVDIFFLIVRIFLFYFFSTNVDVVLQIIKSLIKLIVLKAAVYNYSRKPLTCLCNVSYIHSRS